MTRTTLVPALLAAIGLAAVVGCEDKPRAPALATESVYQNDEIGLKFATPDGWVIQTKTDLPSGRLPKPILLASYLSPKGDGPQLQVEAANAVPDEELDAGLATLKAGGEGWAVKEPRKRVTVNGIEASRVTLVRPTKRGEQLREVTTFQRGERTYFFSIVFHSSDLTARDQADLSVRSVMWN